MQDDRLSVLRTFAPNRSDADLTALVQKFDGDYDKAANAIFTDEQVWDSLKPTTTHEVIDLTADDDTDEMTRALKLSLEQSGVGSDGPTFGPSDRMPDSNWQVTVAPPPTAVYDDGEQALQQAIKLSMEAIPVDEDTVDMPDIDVPPRDISSGQPLAIHSRSSNLQYVGNLISALIQIPQVQKNLRLIANAFERITNSKTMDALIGHASHQDYCNLSFIVNDNIFAYGKAVPTNDLKNIRDNSKDLYDEIIKDIEMHLEQLESGATGGLGTMRLLQVRFEHDGPPTVTKLDESEQRAHVVPLTFGTGDVREDLTTLIFNLLFRGRDDNTLLSSPIPDVVGFELANDGKCAEAPAYPPTLYLDRFLSENLDPVNEKLHQLREMTQKMEKLAEKKQTLTKFNGNDTVKDLKTTLQYYEDVAQGKDDPERRARIDGAVLKLKSVLKSLEQDLTDLDKEHATLLQDSQSVFDCPEMQKYPYDLRAVLVSGGPPGRKSLYSYTQDTMERWWKTVDTLVTEVPRDEVFNDSTGVLLGAGPYMLLYSKRMSKEEVDAFSEWPEYLSKPILSNNRIYMEGREAGRSVTRDVSMVDLTVG